MTKYELAAEILNYWYIVERFKQGNFPEEKPSDDDDQLFDTVQTKKFRRVCPDGEIPEDMFKENPDYPLSSEVAVCAGKLLRQDCIELLKEILRDDTEIIEKDTSAIALIGFRCTPQGEYIPNTLNFSPVVLAVKAAQTYQGSGVSFESAMEALINDYGVRIERILLSNEQNTADGRNGDTENSERAPGMLCGDMLNKIFEILKELCPVNFDKTLYFGYALKSDPTVMAEQEELDTDIPDDEDKEGDEDREDEDREDNEDDEDRAPKAPVLHDFSWNLKSSYCTNDIKMVLSAYEHGMIDAANEMDRALTDYIISQYGDISSDRRRISVGNAADANRNSFMERMLKLEAAPLSKWPSLFSPALMQQLAVNICSQENPPSIFSVNGPPGTGKTTLLKEIVADNILKKALIMAEYDDPDDAFERCAFHDGESRYDGYIYWAPSYYKPVDSKLFDYGMLVVSSNNAAVENITKELPGRDGLLKSIDPKDAPEELKEGFEELYRMFGGSDIFFTEFSKFLDTGSGVWGLISAPLGKKKNINKYYSNAINNFKKNNGILSNVPFETENHKERFADEVEEFREQYRKVLAMREELLREISGKSADVQTIDEKFWEDYDSGDVERTTAVQTSVPYFTKEYDLERQKLFYHALRVCDEFARGSKCVLSNLKNLFCMMHVRKDQTKKNGEYVHINYSERDRRESFPALWNSLFFVTPVVSTTFASVERMLSDLKVKGQIGCLIVDESGQAEPHMSIGALYRSKRAVIVGDPLQIEPVVTGELNLLKKIIRNEHTQEYTDPGLSVQSLADSVNSIGKYLIGNDGTQTWIGCPLVVHRRCINPMFDISNAISYNNTMKLCTNPPKPKLCETFYSDRSLWINVSGKENGNSDHYVDAQAAVVEEILRKAFSGNEIPSLYIISPFSSVKTGIRNRLKRTLATDPMIGDKVSKWLGKSNIGTVHTFQGKEANEVVFLLGCDGSDKAKGAVSWVNSNIVNVAVTRAKYRVYIVGDFTVWRNSRVLKKAHDILVQSELGEERNYAASAARVCPNCKAKVAKSKYGYFCTNKCNMRLYTLFNNKLSDKDVEKLLKGEAVTVTFDGETYDVLPEITEAKGNFYWKNSTRR